MMNELIRKQHIHQRRRFTPLPLKSTRFRLSPVKQNPTTLSQISKQVKHLDNPKPIRGKQLLIYIFGSLLLAIIGGLLVSPWPAGKDAFVLPEATTVSTSLKTYVEQGMTENSPVEEDDRIPLSLTEQFAWQTYQVQSGDTLLGIAKHFNLSMDAIIALNGIKRARSLRSGTILKIPNMDGIPYTVKRGDTLSRLSKTWGVPMEAILDANDLTSDVIVPGSQLFLPGARLSSLEVKQVIGNLFVYPLNGRLTSSFGWRNDPFTGVRRFHGAIDIAQNVGFPVGASMDGKVSFTGYNSIYGHYIILNHDGGYQTMYAHLSKISVKKGDRVVQKQQIGSVGNTGYSTGPHLHFAIFKNGRAMNPLELLGK